MSSGDSFAHAGSMASGGRKPNLKLQLFGHEHAVRIFHITYEGPAILKPEFRVQPPRRFERIRGARFQAQSAVLPPLRLANDVLKKVGRNPLAQMACSSSH